mmetsp:Transcript_84875/g.227561  ORF Transcript_84875/g.227561 Transcript_84875/m.227561 type:complete len:239 (+) Transcript_84875:595-1311(+)
MLQDAPRTDGHSGGVAGTVYGDAGGRPYRHDEGNEGGAGLRGRAPRRRRCGQRAAGAGRPRRPRHVQRRRREGARGGGHVRGHVQGRARPEGLPHRWTAHPGAGGARRLQGSHHGGAGRLRQRPEQARQPHAERPPLRGARSEQRRRRWRPDRRGLERGERYRRQGDGPRGPGGGPRGQGGGPREEAEESEGSEGQEVTKRVPERSTCRNGPAGWREVGVAKPAAVAASCLFPAIVNS